MSTVIPTPFMPLDTDSVAERVRAFREAIDDSPPDVQDVFDAWIDALAGYLFNLGQPKTMLAARDQATLALSAIVNDGKFDSLIVERVKR